MGRNPLMWRLVTYIKDKKLEVADDLYNKDRREYMKTKSTYNKWGGKLVYSHEIFNEVTYI